MMLKKAPADARTPLDVGWLLCHLRCQLPPTMAEVARQSPALAACTLDLRKEALKNSLMYKCSEKISLLSWCCLHWFCPKSRAQDKDLGEDSLLGT